MKKVKVFTNNDLDGAGSLMLIKWAFGDSCIIDHSITNIFNIKRDYEQFERGRSFDEYSKVFILNMLPQFEVDEKVLVFSKGVGRGLSYNGKVDVSNTTTSLIYNFFKRRLDGLTTPQKAFIVAINKFFTDGVLSKSGIRLNAIFKYGRNKYSAFYERFHDGLTEYTEEEQIIIQKYFQRLMQSYKDVEIFKHNKHSNIFIALVRDMTFKHELLDLIFKKHDANMVFLVDIDEGFISVRKKPSVDMDMSALCGTILEGRALENCAGGRFTEQFLEYTKEFTYNV